ncbi:MAG: 50S ribosomal protein L3 [Bdellovibrionales bacterium]|nr:50S ribosomal protein L3 [Bdellovibrionales bacterium]
MSAEEGKSGEEQQATEGLKLNGLYAFKLGMSTIYQEGETIPVTLLQFRQWVVSQVKTKEKDGYSAIQIACGNRRATRTTAAAKKHLSKAGFENGAEFVREVRQDLPAGVEVGQKVDINSLAPGDMVSVTARMKGRGFAGVVKRWDFAGGPASHGSGTHRRPGSVGNREEPGRVMPGKRMAGQYGNCNITTRNLQIVDVDAKEGVLFVKGAVPGARNSIVKLVKV